MTQKINCVQLERLGGILVSILKAEDFTEMIKKERKNYQWRATGKFVHCLTSCS